MPGKCTVCTHKDVDAINALIVEGVQSLRGIAARFGLVGTSLARHAKNHVPATLTRSAQRRSRRADDKLLDHAISVKDNRMAAMDGRWQKLGKVVDDKLDKPIEDSATWQLLREMRDLEHQAAREMGQLEGGKAGGSVQVVVVIPGATAPAAIEAQDIQIVGRPRELEGDVIDVPALPAPDQSPEPETPKWTRTRKLPRKPLSTPDNLQYRE